MLNEHPTTFAGIQYHVGDAYAESFGSSRFSFYGFSGTPSICFDGVLEQVGGTPGMSYTSQYNQRHAIATDVTIEVGGEILSGQTAEIEAIVCIEPTGTAKAMRIYIAEVLDYYPASPSYSRNCFRQVETQDIDLEPGECVSVIKELTFDSASWGQQEDIRIIVWAQQPGGLPVYQAGIMNWPFQPLYELKMTLPDGAPEFVAPGVDAPVMVKIEDAGENYVFGTATMHYRADGGDFVAYPLTDLGDDLFLATLPAPACGETPEYYFTAQGDEGTTVYFPEEAPVELFSATVATVTTVIEDNFESDLGWTVESYALSDGAWMRGDPVADPGIGIPIDDFDGSGQCYLTDNTQGNSDVDGGPTILISPLFDLTGATDPVLRYARWMYCDDAVPPYQDFLDVELSVDGGTTWVLLEHVASTNEWIYRELHLNNYATVTDQTRVRFSVADNPNNSKTEAAIDAVWLFDLSCSDQEPILTGDTNCDGAVNVFDIDAFVLALTDAAGYAAAYPDCNILSADINCDQAVDAFDIDAFVDCLGSGGCGSCR